MSMDGDETHSMMEDCNTNAHVAGEENHVTSGVTTLNAGNSKPFNTFEDLLEVVGTNGRWTIILIIMCAFSTFTTPFSSMSYQFLGATPDYWCHVSELIEANWTQEQIISFAIPLSNLTGKREGCFMHNYNYTSAAQLGFNKVMSKLPPVSKNDDILLACSSRVYNTSQYASSIATEWDLTCESRALYSTTSSVMQAGTLLGSLLYGHLLEAIGRRKTVIFSSVSSILTSALIIVSPNVESFIFLRMLSQLFDIGYYMGTLILCMEVCSPSQRTCVGSLYLIPWALGYMMVPAVAYYIRPWRWLQAAFTVPILYTLIYFWVLPESPRWLILHGRYQDTLNLLKKAASVNHRTLPPDHVLLATMKHIRSKEKSVKCERRESVGVSVRTKLGQVLRETFVLVLTPGLRLKAYVIFYLWMTSSTIYYGVSLNSYNLSTNIYLYTFLGGLLEIPAYLLLWLATATLGRKKTFAILFLICGISNSLLTILMLLLQKVHVVVRLILSLSSKMAITATFSLLWYYTPELFSTKYRSRATGEANMWCRIGSATSPYINDILGEVRVWAPSAVFSVGALVAAAVVFILPETANKNMPQGIDEEEDDNDRVYSHDV